MLFKFTSITLSHASSGYSSNGPLIFSLSPGGESSAALFISAEGLPNFLHTQFRELDISSFFVTSVLKHK